MWVKIWQKLFDDVLFTDVITAIGRYLLITYLCFFLTLPKILSSVSNVHTSLLGKEQFFDGSGFLGEQKSSSSTGSFICQFRNGFTYLDAVALVESNNTSSDWLRLHDPENEYKRSIKLKKGWPAIITGCDCEGVLNLGRYSLLLRKKGRVDFFYRKVLSASQSTCTTANESKILWSAPCKLHLTWGMAPIK